MIDGNAAALRPHQDATDARERAILAHMPAARERARESLIAERLADVLESLDEAEWATVAQQIADVIQYHGDARTDALYRLSETVRAHADAYAEHAGLVEDAAAQMADDEH